MAITNSFRTACEGLALQSKSARVVALLVVLSVVGVAIRLIYLKFPGPDADELYMQHCWVVIRNAIGLPGYKLPLALSNNDGMLPAYLLGSLYEPFQHPLTFRVFSILWLIPAVIFSYLVSREMKCGRRFSSYAAALMAIMPSSFVNSRHSYGFSRVSIALAFFYFIHVFSRNKKARSLYWACLALGVGINVRLDMIYLLPVGMVWCFLVQSDTSWRQYFRASGLIKMLGKAAVATSMLFLGMTPFWISVAKNPAQWLEFYFTKWDRSANGFDNTMFLQNFGIRFQHLTSFMCGNVNFNNLFTAYHPTIYYVFYALLAYAVIFAIVSRVTTKSTSPLELALLGIVLVLSQSTKTPSTFHPAQVVILLPLGVMTLVFALQDLASRKFMKFPAYGIAILFLAVSFYQTGETISALPSHPGYRGNTSAIYDLVRSLEEKKVEKAFVFNWGMDRHIYTFSKGKISTQPITTDTLLQDTLKSHRPGQAWVFENLDDAATSSPLRVQMEKISGEFKDIKRSVMNDPYGWIFDVYECQ